MLVQSDKVPERLLGQDYRSNTVLVHAARAVKEVFKVFPKVLRAIEEDYSRDKVGECQNAILVAVGVLACSPCQSPLTPSGNVLVFILRMNIKPFLVFQDRVVQNKANTIANHGHPSCMLLTFRQG